MVGTTTAPRNVSGPCRSIMPEMRQALLDRLSYKPNEYLDELVVYLWDEYNVLLDY